MCFKAIVLVCTIACLISVEMKPLNGRIFKCKRIPFKKHHSLLESLIPSPVDSAVPVEEYTVPAGFGTLVTEPVTVPTSVPAEPQQEVQPEVQYQTPPPEVQYPAAPQQESQPTAVPQPEVQNPAQQQPLYPPQHEGQRPVQHHQQGQSPLNQGLYPPQQQNVQYYPAQNEGQYYRPQIEGAYGAPPPVYQSFTNNVPYNYPVYGQNVLRSVKSLDGQTYALQQLPYRVNNMHIREPTPSVYYTAPLVYESAYAAPQFNYVSQAPRTAQALTVTRGKAKSA